MMTILKKIPISHPHLSQKIISKSAQNKTRRRILSNDKKLFKRQLHSQNMTKNAQKGAFNRQNVFVGKIYLLAPVMNSCALLSAASSLRLQWMVFAKGVLVWRPCKFQIFNPAWWGATSTQKVGVGKFFIRKQLSRVGDSRGLTTLQTTCPGGWCPLSVTSTYCCWITTLTSTERGTKPGPGTSPYCWNEPYGFLYCI